MRSGLKHKDHMKFSFRFLRTAPGSFSCVLIMLAGLPDRAFSQQLTFKGQAIGWAVASQMEEQDASNPGDVKKVWRGQAGLRYIPELQLQVPVQEKYSFDAELSANVFGSGLYWSSDSIVWDGRIKPYRAWMKFAGNRFEIRGGLQKINFGSASLLRPLMWFDRIDPRDPLQLTDGVWGLLGRYYFLNNANIWVWGLYGNDRTRGWEIVPTVRDIPEFGLRAQIPVPGGELATTYHYRVADIEKVYPIPHGEKPYAREKRLALDGKFDYGVGLWFEAVLIHQEIHIPELRYRRALNLGLDYTFGLGNGLNMMTEFFTYGSSEHPLGSGKEVYFTALSANYAFNIINSLNGIIFYDWTNGNIYNFINWSWQFDKWSFYIMGFWNPSLFDLYQGLEGTNLYAGRGLQFMAVFNH
jgi:hypothetical protein